MADDTPKTVHIVVYKSPRWLKAGRPQRYRWRAVSGNRRKLAASSEAYTNLQDCINAAVTLFSDTTTAVLHTPEEVRTIRKGQAA